MTSLSRLVSEVIGLVLRQGRHHALCPRYPRHLTAECSSRMAVKFATLEWVSYFDHLLESFGYMP